MADDLDLVTGATGLIGGCLVRRLVAGGRRVRALVRPRRPAAALLELGVDLAIGDLSDQGAVRCAVEGVSRIFHCGALVTDWGPRRVFQQTNVDGTRHVVQAALDQGVQRLIHLSSASVYGYPRRGGPVGEQHPRRSRGIPYIGTKIAGERLVQQAMREHGLPAVVLRPVMVFGPGCQNYVGEVVRHLRRGSMVLFDGGRHVAGLAYVENVVDAICLAGTVREAVGRTMNVCDDLPVTWREYFDALSDGLGIRRARFSIPTAAAYAAAIPSETIARCLRLRQRPWLTRLAVLELGQPQLYDTRVARQVLEYAPRVPFGEAIEATISWARGSCGGSA
jgi:nucleoside-diphosphate-sugar epimerase